LAENTPIRLMPGIFGEQLVDRERLADDMVDFDLHAELLQTVDLTLHDRLGQAELGDAVDEHAPGLVKRLENRDAVPHLRQVRGHRQARRPRSHDRDLVAGRDRRGGRRIAELHQRAVVGDEALEPADRHRLVLDADGALGLALLLLRADAAADGGQDVLLHQRVVGAFEITFPDLRDELGDVDFDRASGDTRVVLALDAALGLEHREVDRVAERDFVERMRALVRIAQRHRVLRLLRDLLRHERVGSRSVGGQAPATRQASSFSS
jgi:hypothetical protein